MDLNGVPTVTLLGTATDPSSNPQPITVRPELAELNNQPIVLVGTGQLLGASDIALTQGQSIYGITDPLTAGTVYSDLRGSMKPLVMTTIGTPPTATRTVACSTTATPAQCASTAGWVVDLPDPGERVNVQMQLTLGTLIAASNVPQDTACSSGGHSWINYLNFSTGLAVSNSPGQIVSQYLANSLVVGLGIIALPPNPGFNNPTYIGEVQFGTGHGAQITPPVVTPPPVGKRVSWREIAQ
jgi:Tfp pilus tip-associated adhesin PilY1